MRCLKTALVTLALVWPATARTEVAGTPFVAGLLTPTKIVMTRGGNLLVSEGGNPPATFVANHGRVSLVDRGGVRRTLIDRLPAGLDLDDGGSSGPSGLWLADRYTLYVAIGIGDVTTRNAARARYPIRRACRRLSSAVWQTAPASGPASPSAPRTLLACSCCRTACTCPTRGRTRS